MEENRQKLNTKILKVYFDAETQEKNIDALILDNDSLVAELGDMWTQHETAIKTLIKVINAKTAKYLVEDATPDELLPLRHELFGAEKILVHLEKFAEEHKRRKKRQVEKTTEEEVENASPPETEEGSL